MAGETHMLLPSGELVNIVGGDSPVPDYVAKTITVGKQVIRFNNTASIQAYLAALATSLKNASSLLDTRSFIISQIQPSVFDYTTQKISIYGYGFQQSLVGTLYIDDANGGIDKNGYAMVCTYVSPNEMSAVWNSTGGPEQQGAVLLYHNDTNNNASNVLTGTLNGTVVTMDNPS